MDAWSNIEVPSDDLEIFQINDFEKSLKYIPSSVIQIRELITGFEVCHFKIQQHISYLKESIANLKANTDLKQVGSNHIRHGEHAMKKDKTGRSLSGQNYVWGLNRWLGYEPENKIAEIDLELEKVKRAMHAGRYIPHIDHAVSEDVSWENFKYYRNRLNDICDGK